MKESLIRKRLDELSCCYQEHRDQVEEHSITQKRSKGKGLSHVRATGDEKGAYFPLITCMMEIKIRDKRRGGKGRSRKKKSREKRGLALQNMMLFAPKKRPYKERGGSEW